MTRLLIDDTFATSTYTVPIRENWATPPDDLSVELVNGLSAALIDAEDAALAPAITLTTIGQSFDIQPDIAVIADGVGAVAMRTPVRPDEIESTPIRLLDAAGAELLARATVKPFYGITPTAWIHDGDAPRAAQAEVVIVEGAETLREPEGGFSEDLSRAWFILTAQPVVSHVLLLPKGWSPEQRQAALEFLTNAKKAGIARRREWRTPLADREGIARDRAGAFWTAQRLELQAADREALRALLTRGAVGLSQAREAHVTYWAGDGTP